MAFKADTIFVDLELRFPDQQAAARAQEVLTSTARSAGAAADAKERLERQARRAAAALQETGRAAQGAGSRFAELRAAVDRLLLRFVQFEAARRLLVGFGRSFSDFQQAVNTLRAVTGASTEEVRRFVAAAEQLGPAFGRSAADAIRAMTELAKAGLDANTVLEVTPAVLRLATAGALDLAQAASVTVQALSQFRLSADQAGRVVDVLAAAANQSQADVADMAEAFSAVGPVAAQAGESIESVATLLGLLANAGIKGSEAGNALRRALLNVLTGAGNAAETMARLGIQTRDATGHFVGLDRVLEQLIARGATTNELFQLFGFRAVTAAQALAQAGVPAIRQFQQAMERAGGTADRMARVQLEGATGAFARLRAQVSVTAEQFGRGLEPALLVLIRLGQGAITVLNGIRAAAEVAGAGFQFLLAAIADLLKTAVGPLVQGFGLLVAAVGKLSGTEGLHALGEDLARWGEQARKAGLTDLAAEWRHFQSQVGETAASLDVSTLAMERATQAVRRFGADSQSAFAALAGLKAPDLTDFATVLEQVRARLRELAGLAPTAGAFSAEEQVAIQRELARADGERAERLRQLVAVEEDLGSVFRDVAKAQRDFAAAQQEDDPLKQAEAIDELRQALGRLGPAAREATSTLQRLGEPIRLQLDLAPFRAQLDALRSHLRQAVGLAPGTAALSLEERLTVSQRLGQLDRERADAVARLEAAERRLAEALEAVAAAEREVLAAGADPEARKAAVEQLERAVVQLAEATRGAEEATVRFGEAGTSALERLASETAIVFRGFLRIADALGLLNDDLRRAIESAIDLVQALAEVQRARVAAQAAQAAGRAASAAGSIAPVAGVVVAAVGLVTSLGRAILGAGSQQRKTIEENTKAIEALRQDFRQFQRLTQEFTGAEIARARSLAAQLAQPAGRFDVVRIEDVEFLRRVAQSLGLTLVETADGYRQLAQALEAFDVRRFTERFAGALDALELKFRVFDIKDPIAQLQQMLDLFLRFVDANKLVAREGLFGRRGLPPGVPENLGDVLKSLDLARKEDRERLRQLLELLTDLFLQGKLNLAAMNLTVDEFKQFLGTASDLLRAADQRAGDSGVTESFVRQAQITEAQGSQFLALLSTSVALQQLALQTADLQLAELRAIHAAVGSPAIPAPALPTGPAPGTTISVQIGQIGPVTVSVGTIERVDPRQLGQQLVEEIDRALQDRARTSAWFRGQ